MRPRSIPRPSARTSASSPQREEPLGMLAEEAQHRVQMPEVPAREEVLVDHGLVLVPYDSARHPPPLPPGLHRAVAQVDVLYVELVAGVPAADLLKHRAPHQEKRAEHRVDEHRLVGRSIEQVMPLLPTQRRE